MATSAARRRVPCGQRRPPGGEGSERGPHRRTAPRRLARQPGTNAWHCTGMCWKVCLYEWGRPGPSSAILTPGSGRPSMP